MRGLGILRLLLLGFTVCSVLTMLSGIALGADGLGLRNNHPAVGSWFGKAVEDCVGPHDSNCGGLGLPAVTIFMTPSFYEDGNFLGNDSLALSAPPFGPHTTAHGQWVPTSRNGLVADIVFLLNPTPPEAGKTGAVHIKYSATVITPDVMVGYVNIYFFPPLDLEWQELAPRQFPDLPPLANQIAAPPPKVFTAQSQCVTAGCPLVFKFTVERVAP